MAIVSLDDVRNEVPNLTLSATSRPSQQQVLGYIANTEAEVRARLEACAAQWPPDGTAAAAYLKRTILEGSRWLVLRAIYAFASSDSPDTDRAYKAYMDRLSGICDVARSVQNLLDQHAGAVPARQSPQVVPLALSPNLSSSFAEYTEARDVVDWIETAKRYGRRPWPLL